MNDSLVKKTKKKSNLKGPGPGRPKGSTNKFTNLKQAFLNVFEEIEEKSKNHIPSTKSLFEWATKNDRNQAIFYQMISKMLPSNVTVDGDLNVTYKVSEKYIPKVKNGKKKD